MSTSKEALIIILDVGESTKQRGNNASNPNHTFFERAKICTEKILQRKIFSQPKDEVGLILMGTDITRNHLNTATLDGYKNIVEVIDLAITNWQMLQTLNTEISQNGSEADWLDAIIVATDFMKNQIVRKKFSSLKICLLTTFSTVTDGDRVNAIINGLQAMDIQLIVITQNIEYIRQTNGNDDDSDDAEAGFSQAVQESQQQRSSEELIKKILKETHGALCDFDHALFQLIYFEKMKQRSIPRHYKLKISPRLHINVSAYVHIKDTSCISPWKTYGPNGPCKIEEKYYLGEIPLQPEEVENIICGYMYGNSPVPFDKSLGLSFDSGEKHLSCIGFTDISLLHDEYFTGSGIWTVVPHKECTVSEKMFTAMVSVMRQSNLAVIARYVCNTRSKMKIMALFPPKLSEGPDNFRDSCSLSMMETFFIDNYNPSPSFRSLKTRKNQPTDEQYEAVDQLIDSMDLMNAYDHETGSNEAFVCKKILSPALQHTYRTIAHRAMYPTLPIPQPEQDVLDLLNAPEKIKRNSKQPLDKVKSLFPLETIVKSTKAEWYKKMQQTSSVPVDGAGTSASAIQQLYNYNDLEALVEIGTITPAEDFLELLQRGERFSTLCTQIQNVISDLVFKSFAIQYEKLLKAIATYRLQAIQLGATRYNEWITEFKGNLLERNKVQIWKEVIVAEQLGLILARESEVSTVSEEEGHAFYTDNGETDDGVNVTEADAEEEDDNMDDLLDNI